MTTLPTIDQIDELGTLMKVEVPERYRDLNGHVNVRGHYDLNMEGCEYAFTSLIGLDEAFLERTNQSSFSATHHVQFHDEILVGHEVSMHHRLLGRGAKTLHAVTVLVNRTTGRIASTVEYVEVSVDLTTRRPVEWHLQISERMDAMLAEHRELTWSLPPSGALGTSRNAGA